MNRSHIMKFLVLTAIWGSSFLWIKLAVAEATPMTVVTFRLFTALIFLAPYAWYKKISFPKTLRMWGILTLLGLLSTAFPWILITWAEQHIDSALATVLNATVPMFTLLIAHVFIHDDRMTGHKLIGLAVGLGGVVVLVWDNLVSSSTGIVGNLALMAIGAMLLSSLLYAAANVYARAKLRGSDPVFQSFFTMLAADIFMWVATTGFDPGFALPSGGITWLAIVWLGVLGSGFSYILFYQLLHQIGPTRVSTVTYTVPVVGVTLGAVFLNEPVTISLLIGLALIISGVWFVSRK